MSDMSAVIVPKSDQISGDDLIAGPMTIRITEVTVRPGTEQPVTINYDGSDGRPWKPCKSMARVLVAMWGPDSKAYAGKSLTLYRDPTVKWGGMEVGGIRVSHMSDIEGIPAALRTMALTATKGSKKLFKVLPLRVEAPVQAGPALPKLLLFKPDATIFEAANIGQWVKGCETAIGRMEDAAALGKWRMDMAPHFLAAEHHDTTAVDYVQQRAQQRLDAFADAIIDDGEVSQ